MSPDERLQIESELSLVYFRDAKAALAAALNEVRIAAASLDAAQAARPEFGDSLTVAEAVRLLAIKRGEIWLAFNPAEPARRGGYDTPRSAGGNIMSSEHRVFEQLGPGAGGRPLPPPFDPPTTVSDVAIAIHAALVEVGLEPRAIRGVGRALISVSRIDECGDEAPHGSEQIRP